ncbi:MAG: hypothetical protein AB1766_04965 [Pseudomonadota bacterium]
MDFLFQSRWRFLLPYFFIATIYIVGSAYVGLNGTHVWRQSDVYAQILGFYDPSGFSVFMDFLGKRIAYDIPLYQWGVGGLARVLHVDPLVFSHYVNLILWGVVLLYGARFVELFDGQGKYFFPVVFLVSPLYLHYFSVPLPDVMVLSFSVVASFYYLSGASVWTRRIIPSGLFFVAALVKSPVAFVFVVFLFVHGLMTGKWRQIFSPKNWLWLFPFLMALVGAVAAELLRKKILGTDVSGFAQDPAWYFGTMGLRLDPQFWKVIFQRLLDTAPNAVLGYFYLFIIGVAFFTGLRRDILIPVVVAFFSGWLVFSNVNYYHDYYQIPMVFVFFVLVSMAFSSVCRTLCLPYVLNVTGKQASTRNAALELSVVFLSVVLVFYVGRSQDWHRATAQDALEYSLQGYREFIWVGREAKDPTIGGYSGKYARWVKQEDFDAHCRNYVDMGYPIVYGGGSDCLRSMRVEAKLYVDYGWLTIFIKE